MSLFRGVRGLGFGKSWLWAVSARRAMLPNRARVNLAASPVLFCFSTSYCSQPQNSDLSIQYRYGRPVLSLPLPSRAEMCRFSLRPMLMTVGDFLSDITREDQGVTTAAILNAEGQRVSSTTYLDTVLNKDFKLVINDITYNVHSPGRETQEHVTSLEDVKQTVLLLHTALTLPAHQFTSHTHLLQRYDLLKQQLAPLEKERARIASEADSKSRVLAWAGLAYLSLQGGFLAYLTWYVFAWDVMEPVTYFLTYSSSIGFFAYYILTKQDFLYPDAQDRQFLHYFHKTARAKRFDVQQYNQLKDTLFMVENDLKRLKAPVQKQLPLDQIPPGR